MGQEPKYWRNRSISRAALERISFSVGIFWSTSRILVSRKSVRPSRSCTSSCQNTASLFNLILTEFKTKVRQNKVHKGLSWKTFKEELNTPWKSCFILLQWCTDGDTPYNQRRQQNTAFQPAVMLLFKEQSQVQIHVFHTAGFQSWLVLMLTTMTCVTVVRLASPAIKVLRNTPLVQKVSSVLGETLSFQSQQLRLFHIMLVCHKMKLCTECTCLSLTLSLCRFHFMLLLQPLC